MVSDQEPRYRLVDSDGNIVGSLYGKDDGSIAIQETESGSDREVTLAPDGTFSAPSVETESVTTEVASIGNVVGRLTMSRDFDLPDGTNVKHEWNEIDEGHDEIVDIDLDNDEVEVLDDGDYFLNVSSRFEESTDWSTGDRYLFTSQVNSGGARGRLHGQVIAGGDDEGIGFSVLRTSLSEGDTLSIHIEQRSGDQQTISGLSSECYWEIIKVS